VNESKKALLELSLLSKRLFKDFNELDSSFDYQEKGLLMLFQSDKVKSEELETAQMVQELGIDVNILSKAQIVKLESTCKTEAQGAVHYLSDAHLNPSIFMAFLKEQLLVLGVEFLPNTEIIDFEVSNGIIVSAKSKTEKYEGDEFVLCTGSWSSKLAKKLGSELKIMAGKGYSFNIEPSKLTPKYPSILCEGKVAITPMNTCLRIAGTLEITTFDDVSINMNRVKGIVDTVNRFYPDLNIKYPLKESVWFGFRPCTSTGLPIISKSKNLKNLTFNTGHAMMGLSLGPASGFVVSQLISDESPEIDLEKFSY
jgi:D-amino-acid dehydrogenase